MFRLKKVLTIALIFMSSQLIAAETHIGIGAILDSSAGFLLPIMNDDWFIEPSISAKKSKTDTVSLTDNASSKRTSRTVTIGLGMYKTKTLLEHTFLYYGARAGFIIRKVKEEREASVVLPARSSKSDEDGYFFAPTMGVQYFFVPQFSAGVDLTLQLTKTDGDEIEVSNGITVEADAENISYATTASIIVRYMF